MSSVTPYVMVDDANAYRAFLERAFAAVVSNVIPLPFDSTRTMHAEARIGSGVVYFADSGGQGEACLSSPAEPVHVQLWLTVPDAETVHQKAIAAGARSAQEVTAQDDGTSMGGFVDPFGTLWWVCTSDPAA